MVRTERDRYKFGKTRDIEWAIYYEKKKKRKKKWKAKQIQRLRDSEDGKEKQKKKKRNLNIVEHSICKKERKNEHFFK